MTSRRHLSFSPATALALVALFFALGGSAFALGERLTAPQQRCANGAVRAFAIVTGTPTAGIANVPDKFSGSTTLFRGTFNCMRRGTQVRRTAAGVFEVAFPGNPSQTAVASGFADTLASVEALSAGTFRVVVHPAGRDDRADTPFVLVAF